ncbi:MAG: GNAT family N-acetyltransferase [Chloroflexia bacterium]|nr:GNAT family N-acetyltransferase [Chloroflexia bacterium]
MAEWVIELAKESTWADLVYLLRAIELDAHPEDSEAAERAEAGLRQSLASFNCLRPADPSPGPACCWLFMARVGCEPAGYILAIRIPKLDARRGFLFVDELYVRSAYRRRGLGRALLAAVQDLAAQLGLAGVRLLVRLENRSGRSLYSGCGFVESTTGFCQWLVAPRPSNRERNSSVG